MATAIAPHIRRTPDDKTGPPIELRRLHRVFGDTHAVNDVSFTVGPGEVFGYIGPNGAGKTTSMRILATLDEPTAGDAFVDGFSVVEDPDRVRARLGFMPDYFGTYQNVNVWEYLDFFARAYGLRGGERRRAIDYAMDFTELRRAGATKPIDGLSKGMKQRLCLGRTMIHDPSVMVLDEPAAGLDPRARIELREMISRLADLGKAVLISSHILTELAEVCDRVGILEQGRLVAVGTVDEISKRVEERTRDDASVSSTKRRRSPRWLERRDDVESLEVRRRRQRPVRPHGRPRGARHRASRASCRASSRRDSPSPSSRARRSRSRTSSCTLRRDGCSRDWRMAGGRWGGTDDSSTRALPVRRGAAVDRLLEAAGDRLNPILVKETRQALKSKQFTLWFVLLLIACWITTIGGVLLIGPSIYYVSAGGYLLYAYYFILALPLAVVVPFSAYRSLSSEQEENTRDLLEVSTLTPRQVINGKLGSAALQMVIYMSALAPCIAFTYLLRGVDLATILIVLGYAVLACVGLSAVGLLVAAATRQKYGQIVLSVVLAGGLFAAFSALMGAATGVMQLDARERSQEWFGYLNAAAFSLYATTLAIVYLAASALSTFASANRSTPLRVALVAQQSVFVAWVAGIWLYDDGSGFGDFVVGAFTIAAAYWFAAGAVMTGENPVLSQRVRRSLPQSLAGRVLLTWFNPGPGSGYVFAVANLGLLAALACAAVQTYPPTRGLAAGTSCVAVTLAWSYVAFYLGLGRLAIIGLKRLAPLTMFGCFLVQFLLLLGGTGLPFLIQSMSNRFRVVNGVLLQMPSPIWSIGRLFDGGTPSNQLLTLQFGVYSAAAIVLLINLALAGREARLLRVAAPRRVIEDDLMLSPPREALATNPWGDVAESVVDPGGDET